MTSYKFVCNFPGCGKSFKRRDYLSRHEANHALTKPYSCQICDFKFARKDLLEKHKSSKSHNSKLAKFNSNNHHQQQQQQQNQQQQQQQNQQNQQIQQLVPIPNSYQSAIPHATQTHQQQQQVQQQQQQVQQQAQISTAAATVSIPMKSVAVSVSVSGESTTLSSPAHNNNSNNNNNNLSPSSSRQHYSIPNRPHSSLAKLDPLLNPVTVDGISSEAMHDFEDFAPLEDPISWLFGNVSTDGSRIPFFNNQLQDATNNGNFSNNEYSDSSNFFNYNNSNLVPSTNNFNGNIGSGFNSGYLPNNNSNIVTSPNGPNNNNNDANSMQYYSGFVPPFNRNANNDYYSYSYLDSVYGWYCYFG
ncbi:unnamed protein product [Ambrosiozyma monospora]|uniref:Unnamed protein product n=1 Tax=Ambrosiozyma monospora TaxID=43982 RepID=A0A9W7DIY7_AMBMO|nr:unnamed protein product [Ambrosiozyma monospora]